MPEIKERPVLFSAPMVRAILEGRKTVTRRIVNPQYQADAWSVRRTTVPRHERHSHDWWLPTGTQPYSALPHCPYGNSGDRLWVRETHADIGCRITYKADADDGAHCQVKKWTPSIHMFRAHSRILLEIADVRVERLQDISGDQAEAEGVDASMCQQFLETSPTRYECKEAVLQGFAGLWESINGVGAWHANPWVWVVEFKRVTP
jgi:hypothetical protein